MYQLMDPDFIGLIFSVFQQEGSEKVISLKKKTLYENSEQQLQSLFHLVFQFANASMICFQSEDSSGSVCSKEIPIHITPQSSDNNVCLKVALVFYIFCLASLLTELHLDTRPQPRYPKSCTVRRRNSTNILKLQTLSAHSTIKQVMNYITNLELKFLFPINFLFISHSLFIFVLLLRPNTNCTELLPH